MIYIWPDTVYINMSESRVLLCSGKPPLSWRVTNKVCTVNRHYNRKGELSPKCALLKPCFPGACKVICYDKRGYRAETKYIRTLPYDKYFAKNAYAGIFVGVEVRKQLGKTVIFRRRYCHQEKYPYHTPSNPQNLDKQQPWRYLFASAMAAALSLSPSERERWRLEDRRFIWFNNYIKWYLKQQPKPW